MENLKKSFEKLHSKYMSKRDFFKKKVDYWKEKNKTDFYNQASRLLQEADDCIKELKESFVLTVEGMPAKESLKIRLKDFKNAYKTLNEMTKPVWRQWVEAIVVAGSLVFVLRTFVFGLYHVPTGSAERTILVGDRLWGNKSAYYFGNIKRGDTIIFDNPEFIYDRSNSINYFWQKYVGFPIPLLGLGGGPENWTKRVIAIPGDTIKGRIENGKTVIYRNGEKLDETSYVNPYPLIKVVKTTGFLDIESFGPFAIPAFLRKVYFHRDYTYDPEKSFDKQPFYNMVENDVARKRDGSLMMRKAYSPSYEYFAEEYGLANPLASRMSGLHDEYDYSTSVDSFGPVRIAAGKYWAMGDSRKNSRDSRYWGFLDKSMIHGRASFVIYSIDSEEPFWLFEFLKHPIDFWTKHIRWNRFFKSLSK